MESERGSIFLFDAFSSREPASTSLENALPLRERLLDHELRRLAVIAFDKTLAIEQRPGVGDQRRAAADHDAVMRGLERGEADIGEQFSGIDQVGDAAAVAERIARHG